MALQTRLTSNLVRHFPLVPLPRQGLRRLEIARNERFSFQVALRSDKRLPLRIEVGAPDGWTVRIRRVGLVPVLHMNDPLPGDALESDALDRIPGYVPDPLFDEKELLLPAGETHAFWISVVPGVDAEPGRHGLRVRLLSDNQPVRELELSVDLHPLAIEPRRGFDVTHWFYADALIDWYRTDHFDARFWRLCRAYLLDLAEHGQNMVYVPMFTPPLDGVKRPTQLLRVTRNAGDRYRFDWRDVRRYVRMAREQGLERFEWTHLFSQWGVRHAIRVYENQGRDEKLLWPPETGATSPRYRRFLEQFLPAFKRFLDAEGLMAHSCFHLSDEPHVQGGLENYRDARALLRELAPWMPVMDALSDISFARESLVDMPVPSIRTALDFVKAGIPCWCYYCCGPRGPYLQHLLDTAPAKIAMHGFLLRRWPFEGFLHWGYNYWHKSQTRQLIDPYRVQDGQAWERGWAYGDTFYVYPGPEGPVDSIRWELFGEAMQDYALLQTLGVEGDDRRLAAIRSFSDFPKDPSWRRRIKASLYRG